MQLADDLFLPEPAPRAVRYTIISVDDHVVEPPGMFDGHIPAKWKSQAPKVVTKDDGTDGWAFEGQYATNVGLNAVAGRPPDEYGVEPTRFGEMRPGCFDIHERIRDMNANGIAASMNFPSYPQFCGQYFARAEDKDLALAVLRAYNDWHVDEWCGTYPGRMIPLALPPIWDPQLMADEVRRIAKKGCHAVTFSENPTKLGYPSMHDEHWNPFWQACSDENTIVCLHIGSSSQVVVTSIDAPVDTMMTLQPMSIVQAAADLVWSPVLRRFPDAFGDEWATQAAHILPKAIGPRLPAEICRALVDLGRPDVLKTAFDQAIRSYNVTCEMLHWLASERATEPARSFLSPELLSTILSALERDTVSDIRRGTKLRELLMNDRELIPDLVSGVETDRVRGVARSLLVSHAFDELTRKSLMARVIKVHPSLSVLLDGTEHKKEEQPLIVSWASMEQRKREYDELVKEKIPQNVKDIAIARSYGDLRENFEFKSAKQQQAVLQGQKAALEAQLTNCRGTNFENADVTQVSIGTRVKLRAASGEIETLSILGAR
jgi:hypothetical protein